MFLFLCLNLSESSAGEIRISVANPSSEARKNEPVVIEWREITGKLTISDQKKLRLIDEKGRSISFQIDDLQGDGVPSEMTFIADFTPSGKRTFVLTTSMDSLAPPTGPLRTDAANYQKVNGLSKSIDDEDRPGTLRGKGGYIFDGIGWESEVIGFRLYLDERNAIDVQGKRIPGLHWNYIGSTGAEYQLDAYWGMDVLHIGPALGLGGIGFWVNDSIIRPQKVDRRRCRIIARGPVRAVVRVDYDGWDIGGENVGLTSLFTIYTGERTTEHRVILQSANSPKTIVTGIVKHQTAEAVWKSDLAHLYTLGKQSRVNDSLFMALSFTPSSVEGRTEDKHDHLVRLHLEKGKPLRYLLSALWQGESGTMWEKRKVDDFLTGIGRRLNEPLKIHVH